MFAREQMIALQSPDTSIPADTTTEFHTACRARDVPPSEGKTAPCGISAVSASYDQSCHRRVVEGRRSTHNYYTSTSVNSAHLGCAYPKATPLFQHRGCGQVVYRLVKRYIRGQNCAGTQLSCSTDSRVDFRGAALGRLALLSALDNLLRGLSHIKFPDPRPRLVLAVIHDGPALQRSRPYSMRASN
ncbi:hypothetical protein C2E23DRAFT_9578 [Lenzites betulinus]|nr:hypothetical protein C2E23DRAFT_9578 [Lenzites betulinus]